MSEFHVNLEKLLQRFSGEKIKRRKRLFQQKQKEKEQFSISLLGIKLRLALKDDKVFSAESIRKIILYLGNYNSTHFHEILQPLFMWEQLDPFSFGRIYLVKPGSSSKRGQVNTHMVMECLIHLILRSRWKLKNLKKMERKTTQSMSMILWLSVNTKQYRIVSADQQWIQREFESLYECNSWPEYIFRRGKMVFP